MPGTCQLPSQSEALGAQRIINGHCLKEQAEQQGTEPAQKACHKQAEGSEGQEQEDPRDSGDKERYNNYSGVIMVHFLEEVSFRLRSKG